MVHAGSERAPAINLFTMASAPAEAIVFSGNRGAQTIHRRRTMTWVGEVFARPPVRFGGPAGIADGVHRIMTGSIRAARGGAHDSRRQGLAEPTPIRSLAEVDVRARNGAARSPVEGEFDPAGGSSYGQGLRCSAAFVSCSSRPSCT
jgi:hypothetical protein